MATIATTRPFAYNPSRQSIAGTQQIGDLAIGTENQDYSIDPGGVKWWAGANEDLGYVIAYSDPSGIQTTPISGVFAYLGFMRSDYKTEESFLSLVNNGYIQDFPTGEAAKTWLNDNGYWTSWQMSDASILGGGNWNDDGAWFDSGSWVD
jgi:hypothetical protein